MEHGASLDGVMVYTDQITDDIFPITAALGTATLDAVTNPTITGLGVQQVRVGNVTVSGEASSNSYWK